MTDSDYNVTDTQDLIVKSVISLPNKQQFYTYHSYTTF